MSTSAGAPEAEQTADRSEASWLLSFYRLFQQPALQGITPEALANLATLEGRFGASIFPCHIS